MLVPVGALAGLPAAQIEALLLHELAHIRRHDYLVHILQSAVEAVFFYHPAVWWISGHMRAERELCCDDIAVSITGDAVDLRSRPGGARLGTLGSAYRHGRERRLVGRPHCEVIGPAVHSRRTSSADREPPRH